MYVAVEGIDTAGKSTQIGELSKYYSERAVFTKEPGGTPTGAEIREIVLRGEMKSQKAEFLLFLADRAEHMEEIIKPNIDKLIVSDRSVVSGVAYALSQNTINETAILHLNRFATDGIYPDKVFLLELTRTELRFRLSQKELDGIELRGEDYLLGIQDALKKACELLKIELICIDAAQEREDITAQIIKHIEGKK